MNNQRACHLEAGTKAAGSTNRRVAYSGPNTRQDEVRMVNVVAGSQTSRCRLGDLDGQRTFRRSENWQYDYSSREQRRPFRTSEGILCPEAFGISSELKLKLPKV